VKVFSAVPPRIFDGAILRTRCLRAASRGVFGRFPALRQAAFRGPIDTDFDAAREGGCMRSVDSEISATRSVAIVRFGREYACRVGAERPPMTRATRP